GWAGDARWCTLGHAEHGIAPGTGDGFYGGVGGEQQFFAAGRTGNQPGRFRGPGGGASGRRGGAANEADGAGEGNAIRIAIARVELQGPLYSQGNALGDPGNGFQHWRRLGRLLYAKGGR